MIDWRQKYFCKNENLELGVVKVAPIYNEIRSDAKERMAI